MIWYQGGEGDSAGWYLRGGLGLDPIWGKGWRHPPCLKLVKKSRFDHELLIYKKNQHMCLESHYDDVAGCNGMINSLKNIMTEQWIKLSDKNEFQKENIE